MLVIRVDNPLWLCITKRLKLHPEQLDSHSISDAVYRQNVGGNNVLRISHEFQDITDISSQEVRSIRDHQFYIIILRQGLVCAVRMMNHALRMQSSMLSS